MVVKKSMILDQICGQIGRYYMPYKTRVQKLMHAKIQGADAKTQHKLTSDLWSFIEEMKDGTGQHTESLIEILD